VAAVTAAGVPDLRVTTRYGELVALLAIASSRQLNSRAGNAESYPPESGTPLQPTKGRSGGPTSAFDTVAFGARVIDARGEVARPGDR